MCRAFYEMFEESTNRRIQMGIKQGIEQGIERGVKNTQIKIAIKMLVRNNQTLKNLWDCLTGLKCIKRTKKEYLMEWMCDHIQSFVLKFLKAC